MDFRTFALLCLFVSMCLCQDKLKRPTFPDVFQTAVQGMFIKEKEVVELDGSLYYDKINNRAAFEYTMGGDTSRTIYNFNTNELISFEGYECEAEKMNDDPKQSFFPFTVDEKTKKKTILGPEDVLFFSKSKFDKQDLILIPTLVYTVNTSIPSYGQDNCIVTHYFSKKIDMPKCKSSDECDSTLITISVSCMDDTGAIVVDHLYNFYRFRSGIEDESIFHPPPGVYCNFKNTKEFPYFSNYFSFSYDIVKELLESNDETSVFSTHQEVWFDAEHVLLRTDEYDENGLQASSRIFDLKSNISFLIVPIESKCYKFEIKSSINFAENSKLPKIFFTGNGTSPEKAIYVGKRKVHGLTYDVWSFTWNDDSSGARVVEEIFFLNIIPDVKTSKEPTKTFLKISHVDIYKYEENKQQKMELSLLEHLTINNYRTDPRDWAAFDIASCYDHNLRREFYMSVNGTGIVKESVSYHLAVEHLYNKIVQETGISILRLSELRGNFDGSELVGIQGFILDNKGSPGFDSKEPDMNEVFNMIKTAAEKGKLVVSFKKEYSTENWLSVTSFQNPEKTSSGQSNSYSGASLAAASLVLFLIGVTFGIAGYYVFLKKRRLSNDQLMMRNIDS